MRRWRSNEVIEAEVITRVEIDASDRRISTGRITVHDGETIEVPRGFFARNKPIPGDYLKLGAAGHLSVQPRGAFEAGHTEVEPGGA